MKEYLAELVHQAPTPAQGRNLAREYLQARILAALQRAGAMIPLAFHSGTALRFLYAHGRYSEDLDFALEGDRQRYDFRGYLQAIRSELTPEGYVAELKVNDRKVVHSAFIRFPGADSGGYQCQYLGADADGTRRTAQPGGNRIARCGRLR